MKVRFLYGPKQGTEEHLNPKDAKPLIVAGICEACNPSELSAPAGTQPLPKSGDFRCPSPEWEVCLRKKVGGNSELAIRMRILGTDYFYSGRPDHVNDRVEWDGGCRYLSGFGRECPKSVGKEYARQWEKNEDLRAPARTILNDHNAEVMTSFLRAK